MQVPKGRSLRPERLKFEANGREQGSQLAIEPRPHQLYNKGLGSAVSSTSRRRDRAPTAKAFWAH